MQATSHSHGHQCYFTSCPLEACRQAQKDAELYGFNEETGEINFPPRTKLPWELDAAWSSVEGRSGFNRVPSRERRA